MKANQQEEVVKELVFLLEKGNAHVPFDEAIANLSSELRTKTPKDLPYNIWQLTEHIRITQWDIVEFCISANHQSPKWPDEYWPEKKGEVTDALWNKTVKQIKEDKKRLIDLLKSPDADLFTPFPYGDGQNLLREAMLVADHTSYHTGEIVVVRRLLNDWHS